MMQDTTPDKAEGARPAAPGGALRSGRRLQRDNAYLGDRAPLQPSRSRAELDRRQISLRWLSGSVLTGMASVFLMGGALYAALDGRQQLAIPAQAYQLADGEEDGIEAAKRGIRPALSFRDIPRNEDDRLMMIPTVTREGDQDVVKLRPFIHVSAPLAIAPRRDLDYPPFDPLAIFSESGEAEPIAASADLIYGADIEGEISLATVPYPFGDPAISLVQRQSANEIEQIVRQAAPTLDTGSVAVNAVSYFDPARFSAEDTPFVSTPGLSITAENVSILQRVNSDNYRGIVHDERFATVRSDSSIELVLQGEGLSEEESARIGAAIASNLTAETFVTGDRLRMMFEIDRTGPAPVASMVRISVYRGGGHLVTVIRKDDGAFAYGAEPEPVPELEDTRRARPLVAQSKLPSVYDGIYRAALGEGLPIELANDLVRILAFDVDFRGVIGHNDTLEVFVSLAEGESEATSESEILYAALNHGGVERRYYRFRDEETGIIDYYDETGKSAKQFLLRQPVPNGTFRSSFGMRRHPITRVMKMHRGVDWSAPRGTPIIAAGNGVVEKAGWAGGYGKQTIIRHANGYKTSYNHQTGFAKGVTPGARVRQGQVIGFVGSTGLSTGPHLHYEVIVNGNHVDPMRIKLPSGKVFKGEQLAAFEAERDRIDSILIERREDDIRFASN